MAFFISKGASYKLFSRSSGTHLSFSKKPMEIRIDSLIKECSENSNLLECDEKGIYKGYGASKTRPATYKKFRTK